MNNEQIWDESSMKIVMDSRLVSMKSMLDEAKEEQSPIFLAA